MNIGKGEEGGRIGEGRSEEEYGRIGEYSI